MVDMTDEEAYHQLSYYTLEHKDPAFIHQHIVDAYTAQHADENSKPIGVAFALIGLYLYIEKNFSGKQIQQIHMELGKKRREWPKFTPPPNGGKITVFDVLEAQPGKEKDRMIREWCESVWNSWMDSQIEVRKLIETEF